MRPSLLSLLTALALLISAPVQAQGPSPEPAPAAAAAPAPEPNPFEDWAAVFIAGDYRAHSGAPSEVFDNGRRDMAKAFETIGFAPDHVAQFSVRPNRYPDVGPLPSEPGPIMKELSDLTTRTQSGCLFFFTSHGAPQGVVMGQLGVSPNQLAGLLDQTCGTRPTVVMISACFSGVFIPALKAPNRMILTAARPDRTSFGCGEEDKYTFFDQCLLQSLQTAGTFDGLAEEAQSCVAKRETDLMVGPPSEPQVSIGAQFALFMPLLRLDRAQAPPG